MKTAEEWARTLWDEGVASVDEYAALVRRIQAEAIEEAARRCDDRAEPLSEYQDTAWERGYTRSARNCASAIRSLSPLPPKEEPTPAPTDRETPP